MNNIAADDYDFLLNIFDHLDTPSYWLSPNEIELMEKDPDKYLLFACCLDAKCENAKNNFEKYSKKNLCNYIKENLSIS